ESTPRPLPRSENLPRSWFRWSLASLGPPATVRDATGVLHPRPDGRQVALLRDQANVVVTGGAAGVEYLHHLAVRDLFVAANGDGALRRLGMDPLDLRCHLLRADDDASDVDRPVVLHRDRQLALGIRNRFAFDRWQIHRHAVDERRYDNHEDDQQDEADVD